MRYLDSLQLDSFHAIFLAKLKKHAVERNTKRWGYPGGFTDCDTYLFNTAEGPMYIGHSEILVENRWWIPIIIKPGTDAQDFTIDYELNIPKEPNLHVSLHYAVDEENKVHILHKGIFTVTYGVSMKRFFDYYRVNQGKWPVRQFSKRNYVELGVISLKMADAEFNSLIESLASFATYATAYKQAVKAQRQK